MALHFKQFSDETTAASRAAWVLEAQGGQAFPTEVERLFDWVASHQEIVDHDAVAFGIFDGKSDEAIGICELTIQRRTARSKWVKMLRLHLRPSVDAQMQDGDSDKAMSVFVVSMQGTLKLQMTHNATTLKVYGRTNEQLNFLKALLKQIQPAIEDKPIRAAIEGRFLSIVVD